MSWAVHVVDDDEAVRSSQLFALSAVGYRPIGYDSAQDFLARGRQHRGVLVTDERMPGMNGTAMIRKLREDGFSMPIILATGHPSDLLRSEATSAGADLVLEKPVSLELLRAAIGRLTAGWE